MRRFADTLILHICILRCAILDARFVRQSGAVAKKPLALVADEDTNNEAILRAVAIDANVELASALALKDGATMALDSISEAEADSEMDIRSIGGDSDGPATLEEYCAEGGQTDKDSHMKKGARVMANWEGYGHMYEGTVVKENSDDTVDIKYDDGFEEERVPGKNVQPHPDNKKETSESETTKGGKKNDDAACEMKDFLKDTKEKLQDVKGAVVGWIAAQRAKIAGDNASPQAPASLQQPVTTAPPVMPVAPAAAPPASPAAAITDPAAAVNSEDLRNLEKQLAERDQYIEELEQRFAENNEHLQKYVPAAPPAPAGIQTINDLIRQYKEKIAQRDVRIKELEQAIGEQEKELARLSGKQMSLSEIDAKVRDLEKDAAKAQRKRDELEKDGKLDEDLRLILDTILKAVGKMRDKVSNLLALEAQAEERKAEVNAEEREAVKAARERAKEMGTDPDKAAAEALEKFKLKNEASIKHADMEVLGAAQELDNDVIEAEVGAEKLDTGLHPHGAKWWRYRYEHSYIEALLMIFISFLMLLWSEIIYHFRVWVNQVASMGKAGVLTAADLENDDAHSALYLNWLKMFTEQMCVCVFVFLTVWVIAKTSLINFAPMLIRPSPDMRVPLEPDEYRKLALDICTIFFIAIVFYFTLMFSVASATRSVTAGYDALEKENAQQEARGGSSSFAQAEGQVPRRRGSVFSAVNSIDEYATQKYSFQLAMEDILDNSTDDDMIALKEDIGGSLDRFPLHLYLTLCVRTNVAKMFFFGWIMWLPTIALFLALCLMHRFAHVGYLRIMIVFSLCVLVLIGWMAWLTWRIKNQAEAAEADPTAMKPTKTTGKQIRRAHSHFSYEAFVLGLLQFSLFFVCYGVARMICQTWMWELHFWPVLTLTVVAFICAALFILLIAPAIPSFCAAMAMPPYVDKNNFQCMRDVVKEEKNNERAAP